MRTRLFTFLMTMVLVAGLSSLGCSSKPPESAPKATIGDAVTTEETTQAEDTPAPEEEYKPEMVSEISYEETPEEVAAPAEKISYTVDNDNSSITWVGYGGLMGSMEGGFSVFSGTVEVSDTNLETTVVDLTVDMTTVFSDAKALTTKLRGEEFFETETHPTATFKTTSVKRTAGGSYNVTGNLMLRGEEKSISFPAEIKVDGDVLSAKAEFTFDRHAWGIDYHGTGDNLIKDDILLRFDIQANAGA